MSRAPLSGRLTWGALGHFRRRAFYCFSFLFFRQLNDLNVSGGFHVVFRPATFWSFERRALHRFFSFWLMGVFRVVFRSNALRSFERRVLPYFLLLMVDFVAP